MAKSRNYLWQCILTSLLMLFATTVINALEPGAPIFSDSFDTKDTFAENWISKGKVKSADGNVTMKSGELILRRDTPLEFYVEFDLTLFMDNPDSPTGFGGLQVDNCLFKIQPTGKTFLLWRKVGEKKNSGRYRLIDGYENGRPCKLGVYRIIDGDLAKYTFLVNGNNFGTIVQPLPKKKDGKYDPLRINFWRIDRMEVDNFTLSAVKKNANESSNLIINSSFEHLQGNFPLYFGRTGAKLQNYVDLPYEDFINTVSADDTEKHSGKYSLKIACDKATPTHTIFTHSVGTVPDTPGVFSAWMKADRDNFPVTLAYYAGKGKGAMRKQVMVGKDWKRYELVNPSLPKPSTVSPVYIKIHNTIGTLWIDDLQAEFLKEKPSEEELKSGKLFASEYRTSELDKEKFNKNSSIVRAPSFAIPKIPAMAEPVNRLDSWKDKAVMLKDFYFKKKPAQNKTECYLACDTKNLYIGYRCFVKDISKISEEASPRDSFKVFVNENIEFFLNPARDSTFYHFAADPSNTLTDMGRGTDISWNGNWKSVAVKNAEKGSIDYVVTVPFADLASPDIKTTWLLNVCRNDKTSLENQTTYAYDHVVYKDMSLWPEVTLPPEIVKAYNLGAKKGFISNGMNGTTITFDLNNTSGRTHQVKAELYDLEKGARKIGEQDFTFTEGTSSLSIPVNETTGKVELKITENSKPLSEQRFVLEKRNPVSMLGRLSFYMNETDAVFKVTTSLSDVKKLSAAFECAGKKIKCAVADSFKIKLPLQDIKPGTYGVILTIYDKDKAVARTNSKLIKREYWEGATQINHFSRALMHKGKPFVQFAPFVLTSGFSENQVKAQLSILDRYGFKYVHTLVSFLKEASIKSGVSFMDEAIKRDFMVMLWTGYRKVSEDKWPELIKRFNYPNIASQMVMDEPELSLSSEESLTFLRKMHPLFPYQPTHMNNTVLGIPNRYANLETDIIMLDDYLTNREGRTVASIVDQVDIMLKAGAEEGKPCYFFIVGCDFPLHYREPSYAEQIAQSYGSIAAGCTGLSYFYGWPTTMGNWKAYLQLNKEILSLSDVITSEEDCSDSQSSCDPKLLRHRTKKYNGNLYLITCNIDKDPAGKVTFTLPTDYQYSGDVEVLFENRNIKINNGQFSDDFPGHFRHVYKIKLK